MQTQSKPGIYKPRNPKASQYYQCVELYHETLEACWEKRYERQYGFWRPYVKDVMLRYLDCGDLQCGFARVKCKGCGHEYLLPFSCKRRHFCPSCHQKRVIEFGEWLCEEVLKAVPHRQWVLSIPKRLRIYFMFDRSLLAKLSLCGWKVLNRYLKQAVPHDDAKPGTVITVHSFGSFQEFHPHLHILSSDGCFYGNGAFMKIPNPSPGDLEDAFRYEVFKMLKAEGKITDMVIENMMSWHHSGFNIYCGRPIFPADKKGIGDLASYIIRASFSQERMRYIPEDQSSGSTAQVIYQSKDGKTAKIFDAIDWLAQLTTHIPNKREPLVRYYGFYSNRCRGDRKKTDNDHEILSVADSDMSSKAFRQNWARLIRKIYEVDPLICPKCKGEMRIIAIIDEYQVIKKILKHLGLWLRNHDPPKNKTQHIIPEFTYDDSYSQIPQKEYWIQEFPE
jgi:hypothetical protein